MATRLVPTVARLGEQVGPEGLELLRRHQVVDVARIGRVVEVVNPVTPLVAKPPVVLEARRSCHGVDSNWNAMRGRQCAPSSERLLVGPSALVYRGDHSRQERSAVTGWSPPGGPAAALAASHLQGPKTVNGYLDHLLSLVAQVCQPSALRMHLFRHRPPAGRSLRSPPGTRAARRVPHGPARVCNPRRPGRCARARSPRPLPRRRRSASR